MQKTRISPLRDSHMQKNMAGHWHCGHRGLGSTTRLYLTSKDMVLLRNPLTVNQHSQPPPLWQLCQVCWETNTVCGRHVRSHDNNTPIGRGNGRMQQQYARVGIGNQGITSTARKFRVVYNISENYFYIDIETHSALIFAEYRKQERVLTADCERDPGLFLVGP